MGHPPRDDRIESLRAEVVEARRQLGVIARRIESVEEKLDGLRTLGTGGTTPEAGRPPEAVLPQTPPLIASVFVEPALTSSEAPPSKVVGSPFVGETPAVAEASAFGPQLAGVSPLCRPHEVPSPHAAAFRRLATTHAHGAAKASPGGIAALERLIGGRWYAVIGAVVLIVGVGLFFQLAVKSGWIVVTPTRRCITGVLFGLGLLGAGEFARRRWGAAASAGLSAAGVGVLYAAVYAAFGLFRLLDASVAFGLLAFVAAVGIGVGARAKQASVAVLSMVGAYVTPFLFAPVSTSPLVLPVYLLSLLSVGLVLAGWLGGRFVVLRSLAWWATIVIGAAWCLRHGDTSPLMATVFLALVWAGVHAELTASARRFGLLGIEPEDTPVRKGTIKSMFVAPVGLDLALAWRPLASSFSTSAWVFVLGIQVYRGWGGLPDWTVPAGMVLMAGLLAGALAGNLRVLRDPPETDSQRLGACLAVQTGALVIATVALGTSGAAQTISWTSMGVAVVLAGRWMRSRGLDAYGVVVLGLATGRAVAWDAWFGTLNKAGVPIAGLYLTAWSLLMLGLAAGWAIVGSVLRKGEPDRSMWRSVGTTALGVGIVVAFTGLMHRNARAESVTAAALTMGLALALAAWGLRSDGMRFASVLAAGVASLVAALSIAGLGMEHGGVKVGGVHLDAWSAVRTYAGLVWIGAAWLSFLKRERIWAIVAVGAAGLGVGLLALALVNEQSSAAGISVGWTLLAVCIGGLRFAQPRLGFDRWALVVLVAALGAWIVAYPYWSVETWDPSRAGVGTHASLWIGLLACAGMAALARFVMVGGGPSPAIERSFVNTAWAGALVSLFAATSVEVSRAAMALASGSAARGAAVSMWWGLFAAGLISAGFLVRRKEAPAEGSRPRGVPIVRQAGLLLLAAATAKALLVDLSEVEPIWRVASFVGLGLLMLAVAVVYSKASAQVASRGKHRNAAGSLPSSEEEGPTI